jgi:hypothetical protein
MLTISIDASGPIAAVEKMIAGLTVFPTQIAEELTTWQTEDMRRRYPNTEPDDGGATTKIWPTSRVVEQDKKKIAAAMKTRKSSGGRPLSLVVRSGTQRPILRPQLYAKLVKRMDELTKKELTWR